MSFFMIKKMVERVKNDSEKEHKKIPKNDGTMACGCTVISYLRVRYWPHERLEVLHKNVVFLFGHARQGLQPVTNITAT